jgi:hypothetical protein
VQRLRWAHALSAAIQRQVWKRPAGAFEISGYEDCGASRQQRPFFSVTILNPFVGLEGFLSVIDAIEDDVCELRPALPHCVERSGIRVEFYAAYRATEPAEKMFHRAALIEGFKSMRRQTGD